MELAQKKEEQPAVGNAGGEQGEQGKQTKKSITTTLLSQQSVSSQESSEKNNGYITKLKQILIDDQNKKDQNPSSGLRKLQRKAIEDTIEMMKNNLDTFTGGYYDIAPGIGKTLLYGLMIQAFGEGTLLTVPKDLIQQTMSSLVQETGIDQKKIFLLSTQHDQEEKKKQIEKAIQVFQEDPSTILISSSDTLLAYTKKCPNHMDQLAPHIKILMTDEGHLIKGKKKRETLEKIEKESIETYTGSKHHFLFTATPKNTVGALQDRHTPISKIPFWQGVDDGVVIQPTLRKVGYAFYQHKNATWGDQRNREYQTVQGINQTLIPTRHALCNEYLSLLTEYPSQRMPAIGNCENLKQAKDIQKYLKSKDKNFAIVSSHQADGSIDRDSAKEQLASGNVDGILIINMYQGADFPFFKVGINFYPTDSDQEQKQFFGRYTRCVELHHITQYQEYLSNNPSLKKEYLQELLNKSSANTFHIEPKRRQQTKKDRGTEEAKKRQNMIERFLVDGYLHPLTNQAILPKKDAPFYTYHSSLQDKLIQDLLGRNENDFRALLSSVQSGASEEGCYQELIQEIRNCEDDTRAKIIQCLIPEIQLGKDRKYDTEDDTDVMFIRDIFAINNTQLSEREKLSCKNDTNKEKKLLETKKVKALTWLFKGYPHFFKSSTLSQQEIAKLFVILGVC